MEMRVNEVAKRLGVSRYHVVHLLHAGKLTGKRWGREWMFDSESVELYLVTRRKYTKKSFGIHAQNIEIQDIQPEVANGVRSSN